MMVWCFVAMVTYNLDHNINFCFFVFVSQVLNCKYVHLIFCHKKFCSENVFQVYVRQFDGVVAVVT